MVTKRRNRPVYEAVLYHDSEFNAAEEDRHVGYFPSLQSAVDAVNAERGDYWQTGSVYYGFLWEAVFGESPEHFEMDDREPSWFVGTDGRPDR